MKAKLKAIEVYKQHEKLFKEIAIEDYQKKIALIKEHSIITLKASISALESSQLNYEWIEKDIAEFLKDRKEASQRYRESLLF